MTIADISIAVSLTMPTVLDQDYSKYPKLSDWLTRMHSHQHWKTVDARFQPCRQDLKTKIQKKSSF